jgi:thiamine-phosphate diphosphorylase/hydroxyethylthiazole kinase
VDIVSSLISHVRNLGTAVTVFCGAARLEGSTYSHELVTGDMLLGVLAGILVYTIAGQKAGEREDVRGPGTFRSAFIDELYHVTDEDVLRLAKVEIL